MTDYVGEAWEDIKPHVEDSIRNGDFEMRHYTELLGMRSAEEAEEYRQLRAANDLQDTWDELQAVPSYVEQQAAAFAAEQEEE